MQADPYGQDPDTKTGELRPEERQQAEKWVKRAWVWSAVVGGITAVVAVLSTTVTGLPPVGLFALADAGFAFSLAYWIRRQSRIAATSMFVYYAGSTILEVLEYGLDGVGLTRLFVAVIFAQGVAGTFRLHRLKAERRYHDEVAGGHLSYPHQS